MQFKTAAENTMAFYFDKPAGFVFKAGQYVDMTLVAPPETDAEGDTRTFSIASAPHEPELMFATRMRDTAFKRVLKTVPINTEVEATNASGSLTLHHDATRPAIFIAGGIGITPFRSIILDATQRKLPHRITLLYSNRRTEDAAFLDELREAEKQNEKFALIATFTKPTPPGTEPHTNILKNVSMSSGVETGHITAETMKKYAPDLAASIYYIAGSPAFVEAMRQMLDTAGVDGNNVRSEDFAGY